MPAKKSYSVFADGERTTSGEPLEVTLAVKSLVDARDPRMVLVFDDTTGAQVDLDLRGTADEIAARVSPGGAHLAAEDEERETPPARRGPGRPKLGVVGREVTLLPRHWEWLKAQPGGASVALRKLVEQARRENAGRDRVRRAQGAAHGFMSAIAGNEPGFEEALRALYAGDARAFEARIADWPPDVCDYTRRLAAGAFEGGE